MEKNFRTAAYQSINATYKYRTHKGYTADY